MTAYQVAIRRVFRVVNGGTPTSDENNWGGGVPWATPVDLGRQNGRVLASTERTLTEDGLETGSNTVAAGSLIVSTRAPIGYVSQVDRPTAFNQGCRGLEPRADVDIRFFRYQLSASSERLAALGQGSTFVELSGGTLADFPIAVPPLDEQRAIADYLDREMARIDALLDGQRRLLALLNERVDCLIKRQIGESTLVTADGNPAQEIRRVLAKVRRPFSPGAPVITAYRDGEVNARSVRRSEGYTMAATDETYQGVTAGDVVVHGLDGFAGAIGTSRASGCCSPVYHVAEPLNNNDGRYLGRLLRTLAVDGYLGLHATSTRERAVDFRNWELFGAIRIPVADAAEQARVGELLDRITPLEAAFAQSAVLLGERRQALISRVVTGQLPIPVPA